MKPPAIGFIVGSAISAYLSMMYLYSIWLPLTAACILLAGAIGMAFGQRFRISLISALICMVSYFGYFWLWPEVVASTASSPAAHYRAGELLKVRAQFFPDWPRAYEHYKTAAAANFPPALCAMGEFHSTGYMSVKKDQSLAIDYYARAADLGDAGAARAVKYLTDKRDSTQGEQDADGTPH